MYNQFLLKDFLQIEQQQIWSPPLPHIFLFENMNYLRPASYKLALIFLKIFIISFST